MPRFALFLLFLSISVAVAPRMASADQRFRVVDQLGPQEMEEDTTIYVDDVTVGSFKLNRTHTSAGFDASVPDAKTHTYRMCGKVITQGPDGEVQTHIVDTSGTFTQLQGRVFAAMTDDFVTFFMADVSPDLFPSTIHRNKGRGCSPVTS